MPYAFLADLVVSFHFLWILFLIFGGWWGRRYRWVKRIHLAGLVLAFFVETFDWFCPLTHLEVWLREKGDQAGYSGAFIGHYLNQLIYLDASRSLMALLTILLCLVNAWWYLSPPKRR
ncbi:hypothetical protein GMST_41370 [Geomonas silvestris]|uniref:DUF2784 domain-containing protein n=1 Tax=Geomonas silvestris TaxID=2740184 RepID=A0A6V8MPG7_9BACT|nr:DUF2784 domain-containing protein [Geomonas silvestris]GFO61812.1 hypothetical protein GMST_41370 [Geomonas silvestris]